MKTIQRQLFRLAWGLFAPMACLCSCSDDDGDPRTSAVDDKVWDLDKNMDAGYRPGDDYYMHCIGSWWDNTDLGGAVARGFMFDAIEVIRQ